MRTSWFKKFITMALSVCLLLSYGVAMAQGDGYTATLSLSKQEVTIGEPLEAKLDIQGGTEPFKIDYHWYVKEGDPEQVSELHITWRTQQTSDTFTPAYGHGGSVGVEMTDARGHQAYLTADFTILGSTPQPIIINATLDRDTANIDAQEAILAQWSAQGGSGTYTYYYSWSINNIDPQTGLPTGNSATVQMGSGEDLTQDSFVPQSGIQGNFRIAVQDSLGRFAEKTLPFQLQGGTKPLSGIVTLNVDRVDASLGEQMTATVTPQGGSGEYRWQFLWFIRAKGANSAMITDALYDTTETTHSYRPYFGEEGFVDVEIYDVVTNEGIRLTSDRFSISGGFEPLIALIKLDERSVATGERITASWTLSGGKEPLKIASAEWIIDGEEGYIIRSEEADVSGSSASHLARVGSKGRLRLMVEDALGNTASIDSEEFSITGDPLPVVQVIELLPAEITLFTDETILVQANVLPQDAFDKRVAWYSEDESVCTVSDTGVITGVSPGTTMVVVTAQDGSYVAAILPVEVQGPRKSGDADGDNAVTIEDLTSVLDSMLGTMDPDAGFIMDMMTELMAIISIITGS
jgi:hypothetical protein